MVVAQSTVCADLVATNWLFCRWLFCRPPASAYSSRWIMVGMRLHVCFTAKSSKALSWLKRCTVGKNSHKKYTFKIWRKLCCWLWRLHVKFIQCNHCVKYQWRFLNQLFSIVKRLMALGYTDTRSEEYRCNISGRKKGMQQTDVNRILNKKYTVHTTELFWKWSYKERRSSSSATLLPEANKYNACIFDMLMP